MSLILQCHIIIIINIRIFINIYSACVELFDSLIQKDPKNYLYLFYRGDCFYHLGDYENCIVDCLYVLLLILEYSIKL